jgi:autotransporter-associated beta strand protein
MRHARSEWDQQGLRQDQKGIRQQRIVTRRARRAAILSATAAGVLALRGATASAANFNWDPAPHQNSTAGSGTGTWDASTGNWFNGTSDVAWPNTSPNGDTAIFSNATTAATVTLSGTINANVVTFNSVNYTLTGGTALALNGTTPTINTNSSATINSPITLGANTTFNTTSTFTQGGAIGGNFSVTKTGGGFYTINANNTYTGGFTTQNGSSGLQAFGTATNNGPFGTGIFTISSGLTLNNNLSTAGMLAPNNAQSWGTGTDNFFSSGNSFYLNMGTGNVLLAGTPTWKVNQNGTLVIGGVVSGSNGFTTTGVGTVVLSGNNFFSGAINLNAGLLNFASNNNLGNSANAIGIGGGGLQWATGNTADPTATHTITINTGGATFDTGTNFNVTLGTALANGTGGGITKMGVGTLTLGAAEAYTGATTVNRGTLALTSAGSVASSTALSIGSATLAIDAASASENFSAGGTTLTGAAQISAPYNNGNSLQLGGINRGAAATMNITLPTSGSVTTATANTGGTILGGWATVNQTDWANNNGSNIAALGSYSPTFTSGADVDSPTAATPGSISINSLRFNTPTSTTISDSGGGDTLTIATGGILETLNAGAVTINVGLTSSTGELIVNQHNANGLMQILSNITGAQAVTKAGAGPMLLTGINNFTGGLNINGGKVEFSSDQALGSTAGGAKINFNGGGIQYTGTTNLIEIRSLTVGAAGATIETIHSGTNGAGSKIVLSTNGQITGNGPITINGPGIVSFAFASSTSGNTGFLGSGASWTVNGGFLETNSTTALGPNSVPITINSGGEWANKGVNDFRAVTLNGGTISNDSSTTNTFGGPINVTASSQLRMGDFFDGTNRAVNITGPIMGSGNLSIINANSVAVPSDSNPTGTPGAPSLQILTISGNDSQFTGKLVTDAGHIVRYINPISVMTTQTRSTSVALPLVTIAFNTVPNGNGLLPTIVNDPSGTAEGIIGPEGFSTNQSFNMSTIGGGNWFLGSDSAGASAFSSITPGSGNVYRLTGGTSGNLTTGGGGFFLGNANMLGPAGSGGVIIGDTRLGGTGVVRFGAAQSFTASATVNAGSALAVDFSVPAANASNLYPASAPLVLAGGTFVTIGHATSNNSQAIGGVTIAPGGNSAITDNVNATANNIVLNLGAITRNTGGTVNFTNPASGTVSASNGIVTSTSNGFSTILGGYATVNNNTWAVVSGDTSISGLATYGGFTSGADVDAPGSTSTPGTMSINSLRFNAAGASVTDSGGGDTLTIASGGILETSVVGNSAISISAANLASGNGQDLIVINNNAATNPAMTIGSAISGSNGLTKSGVGGLVLSSANTFTGNTNLNGGATTITNGLALQNSTVNFNLQAGSLLFGNGVTSATLGGLNGNQSLALSTTDASPLAVALTVGGNNASTTMGGVMSGGGSLTKIGSGTLVITGANTYTGNTTISAGTLQIGANNGIGSIAGNIHDNATLALNRTDNNTFANAVDGTGNIVITGVGLTTLTGTNSYAGGTAINGGTVNAALPNLGTGALSFANGAVLQFAAAFDPTTNGTVTLNTGGGGFDTNGKNVTVGGTITGVGSFTKSGAGTLTLNAANSYAGNTTITGGTVVLGNAAALGTGAGALTVNNATLDLNGVGTVNVGNFSGTGSTITDHAAGSGVSTLSVTQSSDAVYAGNINNGATRSVALAKAGAATLTLTNAASTFSGGTTVSAGKLVAVAPGTLGTGNVNLAGGTVSLGTVAGFGNNGGGWKVNSVGSYSSPTAVTSDVLTLTDGTNNQARAAWLTAPQTITNASGFVANFTYTAAGNKAADGIAFVIQNDPRGINVSNGSGGSLDYTGTTNSGAVCFNLFNNVSQTGFNTNGSSSATPNDATPVNFHTGDPIQVSLTYNAGTLTEVLTDAVASTSNTFSYTGVDFQTLLGGTSGFVGFTGATGGANAVQTISNFSFASLAPTTWANSLSAAAGTSSTLELSSPAVTVGPVTTEAGSTVSVMPSATLPTNSNYSLTVNGTTTLNGSATVNVANNGTGGGSLTLADIASSGSHTLTLGGAGSVAITGQIGATASIAANTNTTLTNVNRTFGGLSIGNGATVTQQAAATAVTPVVLHPSTFGATGTGKLDLTNNELIAAGNVGDALALVGNGASSNVVTSTAGLMLGYKDAGSGNYEIRATLLGDSDLDGQVNVADLANLAGNFGKTAGQFWINGDFDYNQNVNVADLADLAGNFGKDLASSGFGSSAGAEAAPAAQLASVGSGAAVPEPASLGLIGLGAIGLLSGRRRRRHA